MATSPRVIVAAAAGIGLLLAGCDAGQTNATSHQVTVVDGASQRVGAIKLSNVQFYPAADAKGRDYYKSGDDVALIAQITNTAAAGDRLVKISSPDFGGVTYHGSHVIAGNTTYTSGFSQDGGTVADVHADASATPQTSAIRITMKGLQRKRLYSGPTLPVTFTFAKAGSVTIPVPMGPPRGTGLPAKPPANPGSQS
jgi:copper(I)-binding protein